MDSTNCSRDPGSSCRMPARRQAQWRRAGIAPRIEASQLSHPGAMNISEPFIRRPVATSLLMAGVILIGMLGYSMLPISALPPVDFPTIQVTAQYPGASPEVMASSVTTPLERQFGQISGLALMTSISSFGNTSITLQFNLDRDIDAAAQDVQAAMNAANGVLPKTMPSPPTYNKVNPADTPILTLQMTSETLPLE